MIKEDAISGVTSNPTIFEKAINSSTEYDDDIQKLIKAGKTSEEIYDELTISDVSMAADILADVFKRSDRMDGYVSIEVLPEYAHDVPKTIDYAKKVFRRIGKENIMIKVPGTKEAPEAIRTLIGGGINVNVTLLFSIPHYEAIVNAYIDGLKDRAKNGKDLRKVNSVASVFVSRIETKVDRMLEELVAGEEDTVRVSKIKSVIGKVAVANSKMIYQHFKKLFSKDNFGALKSEGAHAQRVLWASTGTKNSAYSDVKYIEELIGKNTINTMPDATVSAFKDHGKPVFSVEENLEDAKRVLDDLASFGIDIDEVCQQIQDDGVSSFQASFDKLIASIEAKIKKTGQKEDLIKG